MRGTQEDCEISALRAKTVAGNNSKYAMHDKMLYYLPGNDDEDYIELGYSTGIRNIGAMPKKTGSLGDR